MTAAARIAVVKPSWGVRGGFELVMDRVSDHLGRQGHDVRLLEVPVQRQPTRSWPSAEHIALTEAAPELARYVQLTDAFGGLDTHRADLVISTQPPSFMVSAPRHLSIFYHHARLFYDLFDVGVEAEMLTAVEAECGPAIVRELDQPRLEAVSHFLAGSPSVQRRLHRFNGITSNVGLFSAGASIEGDGDIGDAVEGTGVLCVSRHEFPKRTELFVHAMALLPAMPATSVGVGGRLGWVQQLATRLATTDDVATTPSRPLWCTPAPWLEPCATDVIGNVTFRQRVPSDELGALYRSALCVVAPALDEDYGLTALEAMLHGKPVIVCRDGGGLADLVEDGVTGIVVEPDGPSLAAAVASLAADPDRCHELGARGREAAATYSWEHALAQVDEGIATVMGS